MKDYLKYFYLFVMLFTFSFFNSCLREPLTDNDIHIYFSSIIFDGSWSFFQKGGIDKMQVLLNEDIFVNKADRIVLKENMRYSTDGRPYLPNLNTNKVTKVPVIGRDPVLKNVETRFFISTDENDFTSYVNPVDQRLIHGTENDISLYYNMNNTNLLDFRLTIDNSKVIATSKSGRRNYIVHWEQVKKSDYTISNSINFVVMAEGYQEEQMHFFRKYVRHAFANSANFHYTEFREYKKHIDNDFFAKWWDRINVFMFETISKDEGIDTNFFHTKKSTFFNVNAGNKLSGNRTRMKTVISTMSKETGLSRDDVDVYILLVNEQTERFSAYSFSYTVSVDSPRNKQPVTFIVIRAPARFYPEDSHNISDYNYNVRTSAIAHELGHAIARLSNEYDDDTIPLPSMRNYSDSADGSYKWQTLIDIDSDYFDSNHPKIYNEDNRLVERYLSDVGRYVPTNNGTMRGGQEKGERASNYQFGPVNTYFMEGSFMVRLGMIDAQDPRDRVDNQKKYQWLGYSFKDFYNNWPPSKFKAKSERK